MATKSSQFRVSLTVFGNAGDVKSDYFIFERSAEQDECDKYIEYRDILPEDTEMF